MTSVNPCSRATVTATAAAFAIAVHTAPWATANSTIRTRIFPALAGIVRSQTIALTFDDGPDPRSTPQFLDALDRLGWQATFFMLGEMVERHPAVARDVAAAGHEIAVHGQRHLSHVLRTPRQVHLDLRRATAIIEAATGASMRFVRPPYGTMSAGTFWSARALGLRPVLWSAWGRDWRPEATPVTVVSDVCRSLTAGGTVLLHDSDCTSAPDAWRSALGALPLLAEALHQRNLTPVGLSQHLG